VKVTSIRSSSRGHRDGRRVQSQPIVSPVLLSQRREIVRSAKHAISRSFEVRGMKDSLRHSLEIDYAIVFSGSPDK